MFSDSSRDTPAVEMEKISVAKTMNLIRIVDWEAGVVMYTDTTRDGYTSQPLHETNIDPEDAPDSVKEFLDRD